jgi:hypothetical protein
MPQLTNLSVWHGCHTDNPRFSCLESVFCKLYKYRRDVFLLVFGSNFSNFHRLFLHTAGSILTVLWLGAAARFECRLTSVLWQYSRKQQGLGRRKISCHCERATHSYVPRKGSLHNIFIGIQPKNHGLSALLDALPL